MADTHPRADDYREGKDAAKRFEGLVKTVVTTPPPEKQRKARKKAPKVTRAAAQPAAC